MVGFDEAVEYDARGFWLEIACIRYGRSFPFDDVFEYDGDGLEFRFVDRRHGLVSSKDLL
jgi:hypothetical protein